MRVHVYYVYIIECNDGTLYVGVTNDIERRFSEHRDGVHPKSYTARRRPLRLAYFEVFQWIEYAIKREKQLKGWSAPKKQALMQSDEVILRKLAECRNSSHHSGGSD